MDAEHKAAVNAILSDVHEDLTRANAAVLLDRAGEAVLMIDRLIRALIMTKEWLMFSHAHAKPELPKEAGKDGV